MPAPIGAALALNPNVNRTAENLRISSTNVKMPNVATLGKSQSNPLADEANWSTGGRKSSSVTDWFNNGQIAGVSVMTLAIIGVAVILLKKK